MPIKIRNEIAKKFKKIKGVIFVALIITVVIIFIGGWVFITKKGWLLTANEIGDFFAGFAGALSFVWIIATIFLQKEELELQRAEVKRLADETVNQSALLSSTAKANFQTRWKTALENIIRSHSTSLANINEKVAFSLCQKDNIHKELEREYLIKTSRGFDPNRITMAVIYFLNARKGKEVKLKLSVKINNGGYSTLLPNEEILDVIFSISYSNLAIAELAAANNIETEEIEYLIRDGIQLDLLSFMKSFSITNNKNLTERHLVHGVLQCLVCEKIENEISTFRE